MVDAVRLSTTLGVNHDNIDVSLKSTETKRVESLPIERSLNELLKDYGVEAAPSPPREKNKDNKGHEGANVVQLDPAHFQTSIAEINSKIILLSDMTEDTNNGVNRLIALVERVIDTNRRLEREVKSLKENSRRESTKSSSKLKRREENTLIDTDDVDWEGVNYTTDQLKIPRLPTTASSSHGASTSRRPHEDDSAGSKGLTTPSQSQQTSIRSTIVSNTRSKSSRSGTDARRTPSKAVNANSKSNTIVTPTKKRNLRSVREDDTVTKRQRRAPTRSNTVNNYSSTAAATTASKDETTDEEDKYKVGFANITTERMCLLALHGDDSTGNMSLNQLNKVRDKVKTIARFYLYCRAGDLFIELVAKGYREDEVKDAVTEYLEESWRSSWYRFVAWLRMSPERFESVMEEVEAILERNRYE